MENGIFEFHIELIYFPEREREREKKISLAPGIKFRLADRETSLTSPPFPAFYSYSAAFTGAAWQPDGEARTLMIFFVARHSLRKLGRAPFTAFVFLPRRGRCRWS